MENEKQIWKTKCESDVSEDWDNDSDVGNGGGHDNEVGVMILSPNLNKAVSAS